MILPDVNLLIHAYNIDSPVHQSAKAWWEARMSEPARIATPWIVLLGFLRITTQRRVLNSPLPVETAVKHVRSWLARPQVAILQPGPRHGDIILGLLEQVGAAGDLTTDAHLAALAIEHRATIYSRDSDFTRFEGVRWRDPLKT